MSTVATRNHRSHMWSAPKPAAPTVLADWAKTAPVGGQILIDRDLLGRSIRLMFTMTPEGVRAEQRA